MLWLCLLTLKYSLRERLTEGQGTLHAHNTHPVVITTASPTEETAPRVATAGGAHTFRTAGALTTLETSHRNRERVVVVRPVSTPPFTCVPATVIYPVKSNA